MKRKVTNRRALTASVLSITLAMSAATANAQSGVLDTLNRLAKAKSQFEQLKSQVDQIKNLIAPGKADEKPLAAFSSGKIPTLLVVSVRDHNGGQLPSHLGQPLPASGENGGNGTVAPTPSVVAPEALRALTIAALNAKFQNNIKIKDWNPDANEQTPGAQMPRADLLLEVDVTGISGKSTSGNARKIPLLEALQVGVEDAEIKATVKLTNASDHFVFSTVQTKWRARQQTFSSPFINQTKSGDLGDAFYGAMLAGCQPLQKQIEAWVAERMSAKNKTTAYLDAHAVGNDVTLEIDPQWDTFSKDDILEVFHVSGPIMDKQDGHLKGYTQKQLMGEVIVVETDGEIVRCRWREKPNDMDAASTEPTGDPAAPESKIVARRKS